MPNGLQEFLILIAPLFVAGLVMVPFLIPFFDRKAKADLAEHRRAMASAAEDGDAPAAGAGPASGDTADVDDPSDPERPRRSDGGAMKAAVRERYGPPEVVEVREVETPTPNGDEVLVRVRAASVNRADLDYSARDPGSSARSSGCARRGTRGSGIDVAGVVESVGAGRRPGSGRATGSSPTCSRSERAPSPSTRAPRSGRSSRSPTGCRSRMPRPCRTRRSSPIQGLRRRDGRTVRPGDKVLIDGASGNVGPFAVQIAKALGAEVTGVCSTGKVDFVRSLGADHVLDYTAGRLHEDRRTLRLDPRHRLPPLDPAVRRALRPNGVYVTLGGTAWPIVQGMVVGTARLAGQRPLVGPDALVEAVRPATTWRPSRT